MASYISSVAALPKPRCEQTFHFAWFVAHAHSWYKHLPQWRKVPFVFFLDPNAGKSLVYTATGEEALIEITPASRPFHYTWQTTNDYCRRFGHWNYFAPYGNTFQYQDEGGIVNTARTGAMILNDEGDWVAVPEDYGAQGIAQVSALVHSEFQIGFPDRADPAEYAGPNAAERLAELSTVFSREAPAVGPPELSTLSDRVIAMVENWFKTIPPEDALTSNPFTDRFDEMREPELQLLGYSNAEVESAFALLQWKLIARHRRLTKANAETNSNACLALEQHRQMIEMYRAMVRFLAVTNREIPRLFGAAVAVVSF